MTASVVKQTQTHTKFKTTLIYYDTDTQSANFRGNPLCQATKRHLTVKRLKTMKNDKRNFSFCCCLICLRELSVQGVLTYLF